MPASLFAGIIPKSVIWIAGGILLLAALMGFAFLRSILSVITNPTILIAIIVTVGLVMIIKAKHGR